MSRSDAVLCVLCVHGAAVASRAAILRLWGQLYDACVDLLLQCRVSLAMDTSPWGGVAKKNQPHKTLKLYFGSSLLR